MFNNDTNLLAEAYLSISKKMTSVPSDREQVSTKPNRTVNAGPMTEPAPGVDVDMVDSEEVPNPEDNDTTGMPVDVVMGDEESDPRFSEEDESEEDDMTISNLSSLRDSVMKIAAHVASGGHLEPWQQQKLAVSMENLAEVARRIIV